MKRQLMISLLFIVFTSQTYPAVLTEDEQVVIPTGQPFPVEDRVANFRAETMCTQLLLRWDSGSSSIVFIKDELSMARFDSRELEKELHVLQETLDHMLSSNPGINGKTINIDVSLE